MFTIGRLAGTCGLSRSTLLYYDSIGLLHPSGRSEKGYRRYSAADAERLGKICLYRKTGLSLKEIAAVLDAPETRLTAALEGRLSTLDDELGRLRAQQRLIVGLMKTAPHRVTAGPMDARRWTELLVASGFSRRDMHAWHVNFERSAPAEHQAFLEFLGMPEQDIRRVRAWTDDSGE